jgi:hypothetical protein
LRCNLFAGTLFFGSLRLQARKRGVQRFQGFLTGIDLCFDIADLAVARHDDIVFNRIRGKQLLVTTLLFFSKFPGLLFLLPVLFACLKFSLGEWCGDFLALNAACVELDHFGACAFIVGTITVMPFAGGILALFDARSLLFVRAGRLHGRAQGNEQQDEYGKVAIHSGLV